MGTFVNIDKNKISLDSMHQEVQDTIAYTRQFADEMRIKLSAGIENLNAVVGTYSPDITIPTYVTPTIDGPSFPKAPTFGPLNLDDSWPTTLPISPIFKDYGDMDFSFVAPTPPDAIDGNFNWSVTEYTSEMWQALFSKVHTDILEGGTGLTDSVHAIIVAREQYTRKINQDKAYRLGLDTVGTTGFMLPSGQVASFQRDVVSEILSKDQDALNNITIKDFDLATENTRFSITTGAELEKILRDTYSLTETLGLDSAKATKEYLIRTYEANIKAYLAEWDGIKYRLDALKIKIDGIVAYNDGLTKVYLARAQVYESQIKAITAKNQGIIDVRKGETEVYDTEVRAIATQYNSLVEEAKLQMDGVRLEITAAIEEEKLKLSAYSDKAQLTERVAEAVSNISSQSVASALGAINTSLSNSYSGSESRNEGWSHGESLSESHGYSEE